MPFCTETHIKEGPGKKREVVPCYYIAGVCISNPLNQGGFETFLRTTYPYHHAEEYLESRLPHTEMVNTVKP